MHRAAFPSPLLLLTSSPALSPARHALELADETTRTRFPSERNYVRAHWLLGAAYRVSGDLDAADRHLSEALTRCRGINLVQVEADILLELARLRHSQKSNVESQKSGALDSEQSTASPGRHSERSEESQVLEGGDPSTSLRSPSASSGQAAQGDGVGEGGLLEEAKRFAEEALVITERSGYVLQGADVHLFLAELALDAGDRAAALRHARKAQDLAACDGEPYVYRVAYDEAGALLERLL